MRLEFSGVRIWIFCRFLIVRRLTILFSKRILVFRPIEFPFRPWNKD